MKKPKDSVMRTHAGERELVITRVINAPREKVFAAWTEPEQFANWWGPKSYENLACDIDLRPGGAYRIVMRSPEGVAYPLKGAYRVIDPPELLVFTENWEEHPAEWQSILERNGGASQSKEALNTVSFGDQDGRTLLTLVTLYESKAVRDAFMKMGTPDGWAQSLDRLEAYLGSFRQ